MKLTLSGVEFANCTAENVEDDREGRGGAVFAQGIGALVVEDSQFFHNQASLFGGALYTNQNVDVSVRRSRFENNTSGKDGGGFEAIGNMKTSASDCIFIRNQAGR